MDDLTAVIGSVLVANRGEIAVRVLRTCRRLGIRGVAVFADPDTGAPHVRTADQAVRIPGYLDVDAVVAAARASGADAVHPGYGFLSERADFARAVERAGLVWIGPPASAMEQMGRKDAAREVAVAAGVPVLPAYALDTPPDRLVFPVLVKAAAGGGGKGMRIVRSAAELPEALAAAGREAAAAFGDDTLLIERYVERGRHIEVQILADAHGRVLALHERDCSAQRRHQKVMEEAPAPGLPAGTRTAITDAAIALAAAVGYVNAGTVEFLLDADIGAFSLLEMNTRLQVEHPVTEAICGDLDLVEQQLRVAAGQPLTLDVGDLGPHGHAIEARVYAEDPYGGFLPQAGTAGLVRWPSGPGIRVDQALDSGQSVTTDFDPMLGKIIAVGPDRETARRRLVAALDDTAILGLTTNAGFLRELASHPRYVDASIDVAWLDRTPLTRPDGGDARRVAAGALAAQIGERAGAGAFRADGWRLGAPPAPTIVALADPHDPAADVRVEVPPDHRGAGAGRTGAEAAVSDGAVSDGAAAVLVGPDDVEVAWHGQRFVFSRPRPDGEDAATRADGLLTAPMPSVVVDVRVTVGEEVAADQILATVEAMKMELAVRAPFAGVVSAVAVSAGQRVALGAALLTVEQHTADVAGAGSSVTADPDPTRTPQP
ncbi:acetyl-CoA carboxylase biotin carboxylase subunit [Microlunatus aurantiacus]|uniref:Acetyl-CoA carboxylase biotin carboxylase subunit n=1 Tax=Microlunatus aurantiacus TaxID=446786 RepID=A0ABP7CST4_9ACTN